MFTYGDLLDILDGFNPKQLEKEVNVQINGLDIKVLGVADSDGITLGAYEYPVLLSPDVDRNTLESIL